MGTPAPALRGALLAVMVIAGLAAAIGLPGRATFNARVTADEPQYLLTATSLIEDASLDISDELAARRYLPYHEITVDTQTRPDRNGRAVSPHDPLLPLVLAVPMGAGGWVAAKATLVAIGALAAALTLWVAVRRFDVDPDIGTLIVGGGFAALHWHPTAPRSTPSSLLPPWLSVWSRSSPPVPMRCGDGPPGSCWQASPHCPGWR